MRLKTANGKSIKVCGASRIAIRHGGKVIHAHAIVAEGVADDLIISWHDLVKLGEVPPSFPDSATVAATKEKEQTLSDLFVEFSDVFESSGRLKKLKGPPMRIHMVENTKIKPTRVLTARKVPIHLEEAAKDEIDKYLKEGIIEKVDHPTDWISPAMFIPKAGGQGVRLVSDLTGLNKYVKRPVHPFPSAADIATSIPANSKWFAVLDAVKGYFQIELDERDRDLTTVILPFIGRVRHLRCPMGLAPAADEWNRRSDECLLGLKGVAKIVDDILVMAPSKEKLLWRLRAVLLRCRKGGITLSKKKAKIGQKVNFAGYVVSDKGVEPDPDKLKSIREFPRPVNATDLRAFMGLANQLGQFIPDLAHILEPMRGLLKKKVDFQWLDKHEKAFLSARKML